MSFLLPISSRVRGTAKKRVSFVIILAFFSVGTVILTFLLTFFVTRTAAHDDYHHDEGKYKKSSCKEGNAKIDL